MKYPRRKDQYNCDLMCENFHEIDHRLKSLEGGGGHGGDGVDHIELTKSEYDALEAAGEVKEDTLYLIKDGTVGTDAGMGNTDISGIGDGTVTGAIDELHSNLSSLHTYYYNHGTKQPVYAKYNLITSITVPKGMYLFIGHVKSSKVIDANLNVTITPVSGSIDPYGNTNVIGDANNNGGDSCLSLMINVLTDSEVGLYSYGYSDSEYNITGYLTAIKL